MSMRTRAAFCMAVNQKYNYSNSWKKFRVGRLEASGSRFPIPALRCTWTFVGNVSGRCRSLSALKPHLPSVMLPVNAIDRRLPWVSRRETILGVNPVDMRLIAPDTRSSDSFLLSCIEPQSHSRTCGHRGSHKRAPRAVGLRRSHPRKSRATPAARAQVEHTRNRLLRSPLTTSCWNCRHRFLVSHALMSTELRFVQLTAALPRVSCSR